MKDEAIDQITMTNYLLGLLSEEERQRVEERFFETDAYFEQLTAMEDDLIDDYVRHRLPQHFRSAFEDKLKHDARWMQRVAFAKALTERIHESKAASPRAEPSPSIWQLIRDAFRIQTPVFQMALAASSLLLLFGIVWFAYSFQQQQGQLAALRTERASIETQVAELKQEGQKLSEQLEQEREQRQQLENQQQPNGALGLVASFVLRPGLVRGAGEPTRLDIPRGVEIVRVQLDLDPTENYQSYRAELQTAAGETIWTGAKLQARTNGAAKEVVISLPSQMLAAGNYELALRGVTRTGSLEDVQFYYFTAQQR